MRAGVLLTALLTFVCTGCALDPGPPAPPPEPMPTDGPNQAVIYVPEMTCEGCPAVVAHDLAAIPWVQIETIQADRKLRQVKFVVTDRAQFNSDEVTRALGSHYSRGAKVLTAPTAK